jgi:hypothetical protein
LDAFRILKYNFKVLNKPLLSPNVAIAALHSRMEGKDTMLSVDAVVDAVAVD